jgi:hypothetical protein
MIAEKGYGSSEVKSNRISNDIALESLGGKDILAIKDRNGTTTYLSYGNYEVGTSPHDGYYKLTLKGKGEHSLITIDKDNLQKIIDKWGDNNLDLPKSDSGDLVVNDPPFEKGDKIASAE